MDFITVHPHGKENKGQPIPIEKGQSKKEAVESFLQKHGREFRQNTPYEEILKEDKKPKYSPMKTKLLDTLNKQLEGYSDQKSSDEYKNIEDVIKAVEKADISKLEDKADKFTINGADAWLKVWTNGNKRRIYLNVAYRNGYRPNMKDNFIDF